MSLIVTHPLGRLPIFAELRELAGQYAVQLDGNEQAGRFWHPDPERSKVEGNYVIESNGCIRGDFTGHIVGKVSGTFEMRPGEAGVTVTGKPFLLPEAVLKSKLSEGLEEFCARFAA